MKEAISVVCSLLLYCMASVAYAQPNGSEPDSLTANSKPSSSRIAERESEGSEPAGASQDLPTEIVVTPVINLGDLGKLVIEAEEEMFGQFNELNDDDEYDIECLSYRRTGTHLPARYCVPNFMVAGRAENSSDVAFSFWTDPYGSPFLLSDKALVKEMSREYEVLQKKMEEFAKENSEFREAATNLILLQREIKQRRGED